MFVYFENVAVIEIPEDHVRVARAAQQFGGHYGGHGGHGGHGHGGHHGGGGFGPGEIDKIDVFTFVKIIHRNK